VTDAYYGEIRAFGFAYAPADWASCDGALKMVQQNTSLYAIIGNTFGGDNTRFALPDLRGLALLGAGAGAGLSTWTVGQKRGTPQSTLQASNVPLHSHTMQVASPVNLVGMTSAPQANGYLGYLYKAAPPPVQTLAVFSSQPPDAQLAPQALAPSGAIIPQPSSNVQPYLAINFCICIYGLWPERPDLAGDSA
jgi:microcystin-dependent protein